MARASRQSTAALVAIADELRSLPARGDSAAERLESAGRLLLTAIDHGAFSRPEDVPIIELVKQRANQEHVNGFISAWAEATWLLRGKPAEAPDLARTFVPDCDLVAKRIASGAASLKRADSELNDTDLRVKDYIDKNPGKLGKQIAAALHFSEEHFRSHIFPKLRPLGYTNRKSGYYPPDNAM